MAVNESPDLITSPNMSESALSWHYAAFTGGLSDPSTTQYNDRRAVLDLVNRLHSHGIQGEVDIPQIAVVGSQSVGKSSLIESIAGITLPRAHGTCTRCPIECRLFRKSSPWVCEVYLRLASRVEEISFGAPVTNRSEVEERIRRAQLAILNPSRRATDFLGTLGSTSTNMENERSFSSDLISVRISGAEVDNLSFVDLPGVIAAVRDGGTEADIGAVKNLVLSFIRRQSCLILLVVSAETDPENQGARRLVRQVDPFESRTVVVTTKPDRIASGEQLTWINFLSQNKGFCVKQRDQEQLDAHTSWADARQNEEDFFRNTRPWNIQGPDVKARYGTSNLTRELGKKLYNLICQRLPGLVQEVEDKVRLIKDEIDGLPTKPAGDPVATLMKLTSAFKMDVEQLVKGRPEAGKDGLVQTFSSLKGTFRDAIKRQTPEFKPYDKPRSAGHGFGTRVSFEGGHTRAPSVTSRTPLHSVVGSPEAETDPLIVTNAATFLDEVLEFAKNARTRELPDNHPYDVIEHYVSLLTKHWPLPAQRLLGSLEQYFKQELTRLVAEHFSAYAPGCLDDAVMSTVLAQLDRCLTVAQERMRQCIALEQEEPTTLNEEILADCKSDFFAKYTIERRAHVADADGLQAFVSGAFDSSPVPEVLRLLSSMGFGHITKADLLRGLPIDESDKGIKIMSEVRAYYEVAFRRYIDNIPMMIDFELLKGFTRTLDDALFEGLELGGDIRARCIGFLIEDPQIVRSRDMLQQDLRRFKRALVDLQRISGTHSQGIDDVHVAQYTDNDFHHPEDTISEAENAPNYGEDPSQPPPPPPLSPFMRPSSSIDRPFSLADMLAPPSSEAYPFDMPLASPQQFEMFGMEYPTVIPKAPSGAPKDKKGKKKKRIVQKGEAGPSRLRDEE